MTIIFLTKSADVSSKYIRTHLFTEPFGILRFWSLFNNFFPHFRVNYTHLNRSILTENLLIFDRFNCLNKAVSNDKINVYRNFSNFLSKCSTKGHTSALNYNLLNSLSGPANSNLSAEHRHFSTRNISGRLFYRRRPKMVPRYKPKKRRSCWLEGAPQKKGIVITVRVTTPRKPNSGLRKIARVRLTTGRTVTCHIPGQGHNLHTHSVVLVRGGRCQDVSGCHYTLVRGKYDLLPVKNRSSSRSKYGIKMTDEMKSKLSIKKKDFHITTNLDREIFNKILSKNWVNLDGSVYEDTVQEHEDIPFDIFRFNTRWRRIINSNKQA